MADRSVPLVELRKESLQAVPIWGDSIWGFGDPIWGRWLVTGVLLDPSVHDFCRPLITVGLYC